MRTVCATNHCTGCMVCIEKCPKSAIQIKDNMFAYNACIDMEKCVECGLCHSICPTNNPPTCYKPIQWHQGWATNVETRLAGASGGVAGAISEYFLEHEGVVCSCFFKNGQFIFDIAETKDELKRFRGSKYIKSNPKGAYQKVADSLKTKAVLFIGLPCQVAALKKFIRPSLQERLYTADLICHGTPSPKVLEVFLNQNGYSIKQLKDIQFRHKGQFQVFEGDKGIKTTGVCDSYLLSFLNGINYTENCYNCTYAKFERVSDITLGDSWGTKMVTEMKKGISLILCQTRKGQYLIENSPLQLVSVDIKTAIANNHQLEYPSDIPEGRNKFVKGINENQNYTSLIFKLYPKQSLRQFVKAILIRLKIVGALQYDGKIRREE